MEQVDGIRLQRFRQLKNETIIRHQSRVSRGNKQFKGYFSLYFMTERPELRVMLFSNHIYLSKMPLQDTPLPQHSFMGHYQNIFFVCFMYSARGCRQSDDSPPYYDQQFA
jgi:hypothetical protein